MLSPKVFVNSLILSIVFPRRHRYRRLRIQSCFVFETCLLKIVGVEKTSRRLIRAIQHQGRRCIRFRSENRRLQVTYIEKQATHDPDCNQHLADAIDMKFGAENAYENAREKNQNQKGFQRASE